MEVYAGYLEQTDHNVGRVVKAIEDLGQLDNTLVIYIAGDNGASAEGSLQGLLNEMTFFNGVPEDLKEVLKRADDIGTWKAYNHYPVGWANAMCTPFQWTKQIASHYGGTRNGMVISWPKGIAAKNELRTQWHHCIDIVPTMLDVVGLPQPASVNGVTQKPIEGVSMKYTFADAKAPSTRKTQYFEMLGNQGIYHDGWTACTTPIVPPWSPAGDRGGRDHRLQVGTLRPDGLLAGREPGREDAGEAAGNAAPVLHRGGEVQRAAARQQQDLAARPGHPPEPDPRAASRSPSTKGRAAFPKGPARTSRTSRGRSPPRWT